MTRISGGGGGGSAPSFKTSFADVYATVDNVIIAGGEAGLLFDTITTIPPLSPDYALVSDNGDGAPGLQIRSPGIYQIYFALRPIPIADGFISVFPDPGAGHGTIYPSAYDINPTMFSGTYDVLLPATYFTDITAGMDAIALFVQNRTSGGIIVYNRTAHLYVFKIGPSPTP